MLALFPANQEPLLVQCQFALAELLTQYIIQFLGMALVLYMFSSYSKYFFHQSLLILFEHWFYKQGTKFHSLYLNEEKHYWVICDFHLHIIIRLLGRYMMELLLFLFPHDILFLDVTFVHYG